MMQNVELFWAKLKQRVCSQLTTTSPRNSDKKMKPETAASSSTLTRPRGEKLTKGRLFHFTETNYPIKNVNSEIKPENQNSYLDRYSPKGSCHLDEPAWGTHLLRTVIANSVVECILRAKTIQLHLTGRGRWKAPKNCEKLSSPSPVLFPWGKKAKVLRLSDCENRAENEIGIGNCRESKLTSCWSA